MLKGLLFFFALTMPFSALGQQTYYVINGTNSPIVDGYDDPGGRIVFRIPSERIKVGSSTVDQKDGWVLIALSVGTFWVKSSMLQLSAVAGESGYVNKSSNSPLGGRMFDR